MHKKGCNLSVAPFLTGSCPNESARTDTAIAKLCGPVLKIHQGRKTAIFSV